MPVLTFQSVIKILQTIVNIIAAALSAMNGIDFKSDDDSEG